METATKSSGFQVTQLTAINVAKIVTILCLITLALVYGVNDYRQVIYLCLHISYCLWWLLEQWLFPQRRQQLFTEKVGSLTLIAVILCIDRATRAIAPFRPLKIPDRVPNYHQAWRVNTSGWWLWCYGPKSAAPNSRAHPYLNCGKRDCGATSGGKPFQLSVVSYQLPIALT